MQEYLRLIGDGTIDLKPLIDAIHPIEQVATAYQSLQEGAEKPLMVLLSYPHVTAVATRRINLAPTQTSTGGSRIRIALIGAGGFAKGMHLPNILELQSDFHLRAVASRTGHNAATTAKRFNAEYCTTDFHEVLQDRDIDAVIIATRHDSHATMALEALMAGKHVLLEKPLSLDEAGLAAIENFFATGTGAKPVLLTGFNRRFSAYAQRLSELTRNRSNPMILNYRMNAGYIPLDHWVHGPEGGGRNLGEACHIYDLFTFLTGANVRDVHASAIAPSTGYYSATDNFVTTLSFDDGSVATLTYTALGTTEYAKESLDIFVDGKVLSLDDYRRLSIAGSRQKPMVTRSAEKGQKDELAAFALAVKGKADWPIPLWQQAQATRIGFQIEEVLLRNGTTTR